MNVRRILPIAALTVAGALAALSFSTAAADEAIAIGVDQVARGAIAYATSCAACHGAELQGGAFPALAGAEFVARWNDRPVAELHDFVRERMPLGAAGTLAPEVYVDLVALILASNGVEPGEAELSGDDDVALATPMSFGD